MKVIEDIFVLGFIIFEMKDILLYKETGVAGVFGYRALLLDAIFQVLKNFCEILCFRCGRKIDISSYMMLE